MRWFLVCCDVISLRLWKVVHHDGFGGPAWFDPQTLQFSVWPDHTTPARGRKLHRRSLFYGNLQRESPGPVGPQRVKPIVSYVQSLSCTLLLMSILHNIRLLCSYRSRQALRVREHKVLGPYVDGLSRLAVESYKVSQLWFLYWENDKHFAQSLTFHLFFSFSFLQYILPFG